MTFREASELISIDVIAADGALFPEFDRQGQTDIAEANDTDGGVRGAEVIEGHGLSVEDSVLVRCHRPGAGGWSIRVGPGVRRSVVRFRA